MEAVSAYVRGRWHSINGAEQGSFADAFCFSVQTLSTIGYGVMAPKGFIGSTLVTFEAFIGLLGMAMASGLMFSKFARPTARVLFSSKVLVSTRDGKPCLVLRMANGRANDEIVEATLRISVLKPEVTAEGGGSRWITRSSTTSWSNRRASPTR